MADADGRVYKRKRLKDPQNSGTYWIDVPVIYQAQFKTMADQAQEHILFIDNSISADRTVTIKSVQNPHDVGMSISVERIQQINTKVMQEAAQEYIWHLVNTDPPPATAESDSPSHEEKHFVRYVGNDPDAWVDVELIDVLKINCAAEQAQEYFLYLRHPDPSTQTGINDPNDPFAPLTLATCDPALELVDAVEGLDPPYRLDWFQNIVNIHWPAPTDGTSRSWFTAFPSGDFVMCTSRAIDTAGSAFEGSPCLVTDMSSQTAGFGNSSPSVRPTYSFCDWPIPSVDFIPLYESYSAGTLYKKSSEAILAFANSRSPNWCQWYWHSVGGQGPDTTPGEGALCPELNSIASAWFTYQQYKLTHNLKPIWHPNFRVFIVHDNDYQTWMDGIHDPQDRPDIGEFP